MLRGGARWPWDKQVATGCCPSWGAGSPVALASHFSQALIVSDLGTWGCRDLPDLNFLSCKVEI